MIIYQVAVQIACRLFIRSNENEASLGCRIDSITIQLKSLGSGTSVGRCHKRYKELLQLALILEFKVRVRVRVNVFQRFM